MSKYLPSSFEIPVATSAVGRSNEALRMDISARELSKGCGWKSVCLLFRGVLEGLLSLCCLFLAAASLALSSLR